MSTCGVDFRGCPRCGADWPSSGGHVCEVATEADRQAEALERIATALELLVKAHHAAAQPAPGSAAAGVWYCCARCGVRQFVAGMPVDGPAARMALQGHGWRFWGPEASPRCASCSDSAVAETPRSTGCAGCLHVTRGVIAEDAPVVERCAACGRTWAWNGAAWAVLSRPPRARAPG